MTEGVVLVEKDDMMVFGSSFWAKLSQKCCAAVNSWYRVVADSGAAYLARKGWLGDSSKTV